MALCSSELFLRNVFLGNVTGVITARHTATEPKMNLSSQLASYRYRYFIKSGKI